MVKRMNICISASDKFIELGAILLHSVVHHAKPDTKFVFFIIDNGISEENRRNVLSMFEREKAEIVFINAGDIEKDAGMKIDAGRWTLSTLQRLYIAEFLPQDVDRILYLDCDMLVRGPLDALYETDFGDEYVIAGAEECLSVENKNNIGLSEQDPCINAGMLLIDIERWRNFEVGRKSLAFLKENLQHLQFFDQDIINAVLKNRIKLVHQKYNAFTVLFNYRYNEVLRYRNANCFCSPQMYREAVDDPVIVHFTQDTISVRPWYQNGKHQFREQWLQMRNQTPWKDAPLWEDDRPLSIKVKFHIFRLLPRYVAVGLAALVNARHAKKYS